MLNGWYERLAIALFGVVMLLLGTAGCSTTPGEPGDYEFKDAESRQFENGEGEY